MKSAWTLIALGALMGCQKHSPEPAPVPAPTPAPSSKGSEESPGKPEAPVDVTIDLPAEVAADQPLIVHVTVTPRRDVKTLVTQVRGIDGVTVTSSPLHFAESGSGRGVLHAAQVRLAPDVAGYLVVDVSFEAGGLHFGTSRAFPIKVSGAQHKLPSTGTLGKDDQGNPIIIMQAK